jgi:hypothetical protein
VAVSLDLFGTLVTVDTPDDYAAAVGDALEERGVRVPDDWPALFRTAHASVEQGAEIPLADHVSDALAAGGVDADPGAVAEAVGTALTPAPDAVTRRDGAPALLAAAAERGPVGLLSNCSVPGLAESCLAHTAVDAARFDAVARPFPDAEAGAATDRVLGTYLHGLFENEGARDAFVDSLYESAGRARPDRDADAHATAGDPYDRAATLVAELGDALVDPLGFDALAGTRSDL